MTAPLPESKVGGQVGSPVRANTDVQPGNDRSAGGAPTASDSTAIKPEADPALQRLAAEFVQLVASAAAASAPAVAPAGSEAATAQPPSASTNSVQMVSHAAKGYHLDVTVGPQEVVAAAELLDRQGFGLDTISGVDWLAQQQMEIVYDYFHPTTPWRVVVRARVPRAQPELPTLSPVFPGANWHEREAHDFFGIVFLGHPQLEPFLLPEDATYHPLRKDFQA